ncbi:MAG: hypothetical protein J2P33_21250, partial [Actinobacteria bacterium]|nr:hypothetical protein [Actinomycetota bacterium]
ATGTAAATGSAAATGTAAGTGTGTETGGAAAATAAPPPVQLQLAAVERGRIASLAGVVSIIWLVILALMVWAP